MEPIGLAASILTLLTAAGESCKFLHHVYVDLREAPQGMRTQATKLQCFALSIHQSIDTYKKLPKEFEIDLRLRDEIEQFEREISAMKVKIESRLDASNQGRRQRAKQSCKWLLFDREMNKFLQSVDHWSNIMSQVTAVAQLAVSTRIDSNVSTLLTSIDPSSCRSTAFVGNSIDTTGYYPTPVPSLLQQPMVPKRTLQDESALGQDRFAQYLYTCVDPVGLTPQCWVVGRTGNYKIDCVIGPVVVRYWSPQGTERYKTLGKSEGYALVFTAHSARLFRRRLSLSWFITFTTTRTSLNLRINVQCGRLFGFNGPHHLAIQRGDIEYLRRQFSLRKLGVADVTTNGDTLLHLAAGQSQGDIVDMLMNEGANVNATNNSGETPLHTSLRVGQDYECARRLLRHGADVNRADKDERTPLHSFFNNAISQVIRYNKDDIDVCFQDRRGMTVMHWASWTKQSLPEDVSYKYLTSRDLYSSPYAIVDFQGKSMLHYAAERGNVELVQYILSLPQASRMFAPDYKGRNILHYATASRRFYLVHSLMQAQSLDIRQRDHHGRTVLHHAAIRGNLAVVQHILTLDATQVEARDDDRRTPLQLAQLHESDNVVEFLKAWYPHIMDMDPSNQQQVPCESNPAIRLSYLEKISRRSRKLEVRHLGLVFITFLVLIVGNWRYTLCTVFSGR